jgi:hypothetical protein
VAVDPTNSAHLVGVWQQDRWSDGGAHGLVAGYSTNGGASWTVSPQPFSVCYHLSGYPGAYLDYQRASDPWVSIGPGTPASPTTGSTAYSVSISFDQTPYDGDTNARNNAVGAAVSYDGGATWTMSSGSSPTRASRAARDRPATCATATRRTSSTTRSR